MAHVFHRVVGGLTGNVAGAAGAAASTAVSPLLLDALANAGLDPDLARGLTALASTALGAAVGGGTGAMTAFNEVSNNFLNHQQQGQYAQALTACRTDTDCQRRVHDQYQGLSNQNNQALAKAQAQCDKTGQCDERDRLYASGVAWGDGLKQVQAATDPEAALVNPVLERVNAKQVQALINRPLQQEVVRLGPVTSFDAQGNVSIDPPRFVAAVDNRNAVTSMGVALAPTLLLPGPEDLVVGAALATKAGQKIAEVVMQGGQKVWRFVDGSTARVGSQEAEQIARARVENNTTADMAGLGSTAVRDFKPGVTHRAENINAGQVTDRDGLQRIDDEKKLNDAQVAQSLGLDKAPYYGTQRPAWMEGTVVQDKVLSKPETYRMVVNESEYEAIRTAVQRGDSSAAQRLGGWATKDTVTSTADVRGKLAISSEWKGQGGQDMYVIEFTVKPGVGVREGTVGPMFDARAEATLPGGGHQVQFMDKSPRTHPELYQINLSNSRRLK